MNSPRQPDRKRNRLYGYDYSQESFYFLTSCVKEMACVFGEVVHEEMHLNANGQIAERQWKWVLAQYPYVHSHAFVVMPNHVHFLLEIKKENQECEGAGHDLFVHGENAVKIKSASEIMGAYKTTTSKLIRLAGMPDFAWQRSFYDHIIRDEKGFTNIKEYIQKNPANWTADRFNKLS